MQTGLVVMEYLMKESILFDLPSWIAIASGLGLAAHITVSSCRESQSGEQEGSSPTSSGQSVLEGHGGATIYSFKIARALCSCGLLGLSTLNRTSDPNHHELYWLQIFNFSYASVLGLLSISLQQKWSRIVIRHLNSVLLVVFVFYLYRDVYPLAKYTGKPQDLSEGPLLWLKIAILGMASVVIPVFIPRQYTPVDPRKPSKVNPEQTASLFSLITYGFLDPLILHATRVSGPSLDQLPPLADYDEARNLKADTFKYLDRFSGASTRRHIAWTILYSFRKEYFIMALCIILHVLFNFLSPIAMKGLLQYLEPGGEHDATIRPWVWASFLFIGPVVASLAIQFYLFLVTRLSARVQAILTQLIYEHSLRLREKTETSESSNTDQSNLMGKINNLVTTDIENIIDTRDFLFLLIYVPTQISLSIVFLYTVLGWSAFVGLAVMIITLPMPALMARIIQGVQKEVMKKTDARVQSVTEMMNVIRMVKLFGWEKKMISRIAEKRDDELSWIKKRRYLNLLNDAINYLSPILVMISTYTTYTLVMKKELNASIVFSSMSVLDLLRQQFESISSQISTIITGKVSLDRVSDFLKDAELLDRFKSTSNSQQEIWNVPPGRSNDIGFRSALFTWSGSTHENRTSSQRRFVLNIDEELVFKRGRINLVLGETGSGKTSLLMALLSEMTFVPQGPDAWYNLPKDGGVAYVAQESWVQNETIKENIVFGAVFDEDRYNKVIYQCALEPDISLFEAGDATEVGEKGITLSGGQKARLTLARAIYSNADILLMDDVLAALDIHTSKWIVEKCLRGDLVKGRTVILVTHNIALTRPIGDFIISLKDGRIQSQGTFEQVLEHNPALRKEAVDDEKLMEKSEEEVDHESSVTESHEKLIVAEEVQEGHVSWSALKVYFKAMGTWKFFVAVLSASIVGELSYTGQIGFLGYWASQYEDNSARDVPTLRYLAMYSSFLLGTLLLYNLGQIVFVFGTIRASRTMHKNLVESVLGTTMRWLDTTPVSRVVTRFTQDIRVVDGPINTSLRFTCDVSLMLIVKFSAIIFVVPMFLAPSVAIAVVGLICGQMYIKAQLPVKRLLSNARAPVLAHVGATVAGLASIRAYGVERRFIQESLERIDKYTRVARTFWTLNRWMSVRSDVLGAVFTASLAAYLVYGGGHSASKAGFSLTMAVMFYSQLLWWIRVVNDFQVHANSIERLEGYMRIEQEPKSMSSGIPPAYWPASGEFKVENLSARYSLNGPPVLHNISFGIRSGERVGIVGGTGSGKSSLILSLLRCIYTEGQIYYDGISIDSVNLDALRSSITIIPQSPELLSGTLRQNLDPFDEHEDNTLHSALRAAGLYALQVNETDGRLSLDTVISSGGGNLSIGQRQILALARALIRGSKLLILDEATSAIDHQTDAVIQNSLRKELPGDVTVIVVAHRLRTIMDADRILVLDTGRMVEYDTPRALLVKENGRFKALVDESNDRALLYEMAQG